jgi:hypothetical protein
MPEELYNILYNSKDRTDDMGLMQYYAALDFYIEAMTARDEDLIYSEEEYYE